MGTLHLVGGVGISVLARCGMVLRLEEQEYLIYAGMRRDQLGAVLKPTEYQEYAVNSWMARFTHLLQRPSKDPRSPLSRDS